MRIASAASSASQSCVPCCVWVRHFTLSLTVLHSKLPLHIIKYAGRLLFSILIYPTPPPMHPYEIKKNSQKKPICVYVRASGTRDKYTATAVARRTREPTTSKWYIIYDHQIVARRLYTRATSSVIVLYSHSTVVIKRAAAVSTPRLVHITPPPFILDMSPQLISMLRSSIVITAGLLFLGSAILVLISSTILYAR